MEIFKIRPIDLIDHAKIYDIWLQNQELATGFSPAYVHSPELQKNFNRNYFKTEQTDFFVAESVESKTLLGWASVLPFLHNPVVSKYIGEASVYINQEFWDAAIGTELIRHVFKYAEQTDFRQIYGWIKADNKPMRKLADELCNKPLVKIPPSEDGKLSEFYLYLYIVPRKI